MTKICGIIQSGPQEIIDTNNVVFHFSSSIDVVSCTITQVKMIAADVDPLALQLVSH